MFKGLLEWLRRLVDPKPNTIPVPVQKFTEEDRMNHWIWRYADPNVRE